MAKKEEKEHGKKVTFNIDKDVNFSEWYSDIVDKAELADLRYNLKGFVVFRPWSVMVMEKMYDILEQDLQQRGHVPAWFPSLIQDENLKKEARHVEGFSPEVFWVQGKGEEQGLRFAMRPTSETAMYPMYALWIRGYKDLPLKIYQRGQVWRYETKATRPFIRSREFYWIEAHDCFASEEEARKQVHEDIEITANLMHALAIPILHLKRPEWDKFAGALETYAADSLMPDGRMIQQPSTHLLGQNFAKAFGILFKDKEGKENYVWQTCFGPAVSRIFASLISVNGDSKGLILPFIVAPVQVIIIPIFSDQTKAKVVKKCEEISKSLNKEGIKTKIDMKEVSPGEKFFFWEMKGVPLRLEIGEKELNGKITLFLRDNKTRTQVSEKNIAETLMNQGLELDERLRKKNEKWFKESIVDCKTQNDIKKAIEDKKIARCNFCSINNDGGKCAAVVEKQLAGFVRGSLASRQEKTFSDGKCVICGKKANAVVYIGKSY